MSQVKFVSDEQLRAAIRELRLALSLSQEGLAKRVKKSYAMIQRYEQKRPPVGKALVPFLVLSQTAGRSDLARVFQAGLVRGLIPDENMGVELSDIAVRRLEDPRAGTILGGSVDEVEETRLLGYLLHMRSMPEERVELLWGLIETDLRLFSDPRRLQKEFAGLTRGRQSGDQTEGWVEYLNRQVQMKDARVRRRNPRQKGKRGENQ